MMSSRAEQGGFNKKLRVAINIVLPLLIMAPVMCSCAPRKSAEPTAIMQEMIGQEQKLDYEGIKTITTLSRGVLHAVQLKIIRKAPDSFRLQFVAPEEMEGQGFIKVGPNFWRISNDKTEGKRHFRMRGMHKHFEIKNLDLLLDNYALSCGKTEKVCRRPCHVIAVEPKRGSPLSAKIWIDQARLLPLKAEEYYNNGGKKTLKASFCFDAISFHPKFDEHTFSVPIAGGATSIIGGTSRENVTFPEAARDLHLAVFSPEYIPGGYRRTELKLFKRGKREFVHAVYSDGLSTISLFEGKSSPERTAKWKRKRQEIKQDGKIVYRIRRGPLTILSAPHDGTEVTLMGEIDQEELGKIFSSLKKVSE